MPAWRPLLAGQLGAEASAVVDRIADALRTVEVSDPSFSHGNAGLALFFAYRALASSSGTDRQLARDRLDRSLAALAECPLSGELFGGFPGIAWVAHHLADLGIADPVDGDELDAAVAAYVETGSWLGWVGLETGLAGLGLYAVERLPRPGARKCLDAVLARLEEIADHRPEGVAWLTPASQLTAIPIVLEASPAGCYQPGLAHGIAGVIAFLARAVRAGAGPRARSLLDGAVAWLLAHALPDGLASTFSRWVYDGVRPKAARNSWCTGDPGIATALDAAAVATGDRAMESQAVAIACKAAARPDERSAYINDAGLCHGSVGLVQVFHRWYHRTGDERFAAAARRWVARTLAMREADTGLAGFTAQISMDWELPLVPRAEPGVLLGAAGIGLVLLAATTTVAPAWDRMLLLSG